MTELWECPVLGLPYHRPVVTSTGIFELYALLGIVGDSRSPSITCPLTRQPIYGAEIKYCQRVREMVVALAASKAPEIFFPPLNAIEQLAIIIRDKGVSQNAKLCADRLFMDFTSHFTPFVVSFIVVLCHFSIHPHSSIPHLFRSSSEKLRNAPKAIAQTCATPFSRPCLSAPSAPPSPRQLDLAISSPPSLRRCCANILATRWMWSGEPRAPSTSWSTPRSDGGARRRPSAPRCGRISRRTC